MKRLIGLFFGLVASAASAAEQYQLLIGPPSLGQGGSNPVSFPPVNPVDWQFTWLTEHQYEWVLSLMPGLLFGQRFYKDGFYAALGGGILVTSSGIGVGVDHAYGYQSEPYFKRYRFQVEYRQVIGVGSYGWQFPYTFRMGLSYAL